MKKRRLGIGLVGGTELKYDNSTAVVIPKVKYVLLSCINPSSTNCNNSGIRFVNLTYLLTFSLESLFALPTLPADVNFDTDCVEVRFFYLGA